MSRSGPLRPRAYLDETEAERGLQDVQKWEEEVVSRTIREEELEAGISNPGQGGRIGR